MAWAPWRKKAGGQEVGPAVVAATNSGSVDAKEVQKQTASVVLNKDMDATGMEAQHDAGEARLVTKSRLWFVLVLLMVGAGSIAAFVMYAQASATAQARAVFESDARMLTHTMRTTLTEYETATTTIKTYMDTAQTLSTRQGFRAFTNNLLKSVNIKAFQYIRVSTGVDERRRLQFGIGAPVAEPEPESEGGGGGGDDDDDDAGMGGFGVGAAPSEPPTYAPVSVAPPEAPKTVFRNEFVEPPDASGAVDLNVLANGDGGKDADVYGSMSSGDVVAIGPLQATDSLGLHHSTFVVQAPLLFEDAVVVTVVDVFDLMAHATLAMPDGLEMYLYAGQNRSFYGGVAGTPLRSVPEPNPEDEAKRVQFTQEETFEVLSQNWTVVVSSNELFIPIDRATVLAPALLLGSLFLGLALLALVMMRREEQHTQNKASIKAEQARKEAQAVSRAERHLNDFLAHEVRNPLTVAISAQRFLKTSMQEAKWSDEETASASDRDIELIGASLTFILELVSNMLDLNKFLEQQEVSLSVSTISLGQDVLEPVRSMLERTNTGVAVEVEIDDDGSGMWVDTDRLRLKQVVMNLAKNAIKFVETGFVRLVARRVDQGTVIIAVEDSGPGVPEDKQAHLFAKYQESLDKMHQGTGIGLCLSKLIVDSMGGRVYLDPEYVSGVPGCPGARFIIELPLAAVVMPSLEAEAPPPSAEQSECARISFLGKAFLVVDDEAVVRTILTRRLGQMFPGVPVHVASSAEGAFSLLDKLGMKTFAAIFMDHYMPGPGSPITGVEAIQRLRSEGFEGLIFGCSGNDVGAQHLSAGADDFIRKPLPSDAVIVQLVRTAAAMRKIRSVLLVDDERVNLLVFERLFRGALLPTCRIDSVNSGESAVSLAKSRKFDVIILDEHMAGGMRGSEAAQRLRAQGCRALLVSLSGGLSAETRASGIFDAFWEKPLPPVATVRANIVDLMLQRAAVLNFPASPNSPVSPFSPGSPAAAMLRTVLEGRGESRACQNDHDDHDHDHDDEDDDDEATCGHAPVSPVDDSNKDASAPGEISVTISSRSPQL